MFCWLASPTIKQQNLCYQYGCILIALTCFLTDSLIGMESPPLRISQVMNKKLKCRATLDHVIIISPIATNHPSQKMLSFHPISLQPRSSFNNNNQGPILKLFPCYHFLLKKSSNCYFCFLLLFYGNPEIFVIIVNNFYSLEYSKMGKQKSNRILWMLPSTGFCPASWRLVSFTVFRFFLLWLVGKHA